MEDFGKCMENAIVFDDQNFKPYTGKCTRYHIVLNRADSAELDGIAQDLGIDQHCLGRLGVRMLATAYAVNPDRFFAEAERAPDSDRRVDALHSRARASPPREGWRSSRNP